MSNKKCEECECDCKELQKRARDLELKNSKLEADLKDAKDDADFLEKSLDEYQGTPLVSCEVLKEVVEILQTSMRRSNDVSYRTKMMELIQQVRLGIE